MALTRKFLSAMGIEDDKIDQIISAHSETVNGLKEQIDQYKVDAEKLPEIQKELDEVKQSIPDPDKDPYKVKYEALKDEFEEYKTGIENQKEYIAKENAYRKLLKTVGVSDKRIDAVVKVSDIDSVVLDADGSVQNADGLMDSIKEEWADFIVTTQITGANTATPPANTGGNKFEELSLAEKMAFANENPQDESVKAWLGNE